MLKRMRILKKLLASIRSDADRVLTEAPAKRVMIGRAAADRVADGAVAYRTIEHGVSVDR